MEEGSNLEDVIEMETGTEAENLTPTQDYAQSNLENENACSQISNPSTKPFEDDDDGSTCPVCLEAWTNCGEHRLCSLKCGHLFGHKCILRWLDSQAKKNCPTCKKSAKRSDLRFIYAKKLVAMDSIELENMRQQLENAMMQKNVAMQSVSKYISREHVLHAEIEQLKRRIQELTLGSKKTDLRLNLQSPLTRVRLYMEKNIEVCTKSCRDCRVFDISVPKDIILIASLPPTELFASFGVRLLSLGNYRSVKYISLHKAPIKDVCIHPAENRVLTVSNDKTFKVTDTDSAQTAHTVHLESAPWSCQWSPRNLEDLYIGTQNGTVSVYDLRNMQEPKQLLSVPGDFSPVISVAGVREQTGSDTLLVAKLNSLWAFEMFPDGTYQRYLLPLEGPFLSMRYDQDTKQILVSSRPNSRMVFARHTVCYLEKTKDPDGLSCNTVYTFKGGNTAKLLARTSCFLPDNIVAGHHETRKSILLYSLNTGEEVGSCPTHNNLVLDMKGLDCPNGKFLVYLNEKKMEFFKFNTS